MIDPIKKFHSDVVGKRVLIFGLGLLGRGVGDTNFFAKYGATVRVTDIKTADQLDASLGEISSSKISFTLGEHKKSDIEWADIIVRNASVPWHHPLLEHARFLKKEIVMDTQLFLKYADIQSIGVTGTRGKTTTTTLIYEMLKKNLNRQVLLGGNVRGKATLPLLEELNYSQNPLIVLELSSWQLAAFHQAKVSPNIAVLTNIYEDHLDKYESMEDYVYDKKAIIMYQSPTDTTCFNSHHKSTFLNWEGLTKAKKIWYSVPADLKPHSKLLGRHNQENIAAALSVADIFNISAENAQKNIENTSVDFRLEEIAMIGSRKIINDTTSTTPIATIKALESYPNATLIAGGSDKKLDVSELIKAINEKAVSVILLEGSGTKRIEKFINSDKIILKTNNLKEAFLAALNDKHATDVVLFSPGFTSFGLFNNEFHRGEEFNKIVRQYAHTH